MHQATRQICRTSTLQVFARLDAIEATMTFGRTQLVMHYAARALIEYTRVVACVALPVQCDEVSFFIPFAKPVVTPADLLLPVDPVSSKILKILTFFRTPVEVSSRIHPEYQHNTAMIARVMAASVQPSRPIQASMQRKLESLSPMVLNIVNESHKHAGHAGNPGGGPDAETHFRWAPQTSKGNDMLCMAEQGRPVLQRAVLLKPPPDASVCSNQFCSVHTATRTLSAKAHVEICRLHTGTAVSVTPAAGWKLSQRSLRANAWCSGIS